MTADVLKDGYGPMGDCRFEQEEMSGDMNQIHKGLV